MGRGRERSGNGGLTGGEAFEIAGARRGLVKPTTGRGGTIVRRPCKLRRGRTKPGNRRSRAPNGPSPSANLVGGVWACEAVMGKTGCCGLVGVTG